MKELQIEDEIVVAGALMNRYFECPEGMWITVVSSPQGNEPPVCD